MTQRVRTRTFVDIEDLELALRGALTEAIGRPAPVTSTALLVAQCWHETGRTKSCWNFNLGNVQCFAPSKMDYVVYTASELVKDATVMRRETFRAYDSLQAGAQAWVAFFAKSPRYLRVWEAIVAGATPEQYAHLLKVCGYYTADEGEYARGIASLYKEFMSQRKRDTDPETPQTKPVV